MNSDLIVAIPESWRVELLISPELRASTLQEIERLGPGATILDWGDSLNAENPLILAALDQSIAELAVKLPPSLTSVGLLNVLQSGLWLSGAHRLLKNARSRNIDWIDPSRRCRHLPQDLVSYLTPALDRLERGPKKVSSTPMNQVIDRSKGQSGQPLRVALIGHVGNSVVVRGGLEVLLDEVAAALRRRGVVVVRRLDEAADRPDLFHFVGAFYGLSGAWRAAAGYPRALFPVLLRDDRTLAWWRSSVDRMRSRLPWSLLNARRRMLTEADLVIASSTGEEADAAALGARNTAVLRAGIDSRRFYEPPAPIENLPPPWRQRARTWQEKSRRLVSVGRLERRKNQMEIAEAGRRLDCHTLLIGRPSPTEPTYVQHLTKTPDGRLEVWLDPPRIVVDWALATSHVHALATRHETIGLVSLEAASAGCRPVAIDQPSSREYLLPFGVLAASPDPEDLSRAIDEAFARGRLQDAEKEPLARLSWDTLAGHLVDAYRSILEERASTERAAERQR